MNHQDIHFLSFYGSDVDKPEIQCKLKKFQVDSHEFYLAPNESKKGVYVYPAASIEYFVGNGEPTADYFEFSKWQLPNGETKVRTCLTRCEDYDEGTFLIWGRESFNFTMPPSMPSFATFMTTKPERPGRPVSPETMQNVYYESEMRCLYALTQTIPDLAEQCDPFDCSFLRKFNPQSYERIVVMYNQRMRTIAIDDDQHLLIIKNMRFSLSDCNHGFWDQHGSVA